MTKARHLAMSCMVYLICKTRNCSTFDKSRVDIDRIFVKIEVHVYRTLNIGSLLTPGQNWPRVQGLIPDQVMSESGLKIPFWVYILTFTHKKKRDVNDKIDVCPL